MKRQRRFIQPREESCYSSPSSLSKGSIQDSLCTSEPPSPEWKGLPTGGNVHSMWAGWALHEGVCLSVLTRSCHPPLRVQFTHCSHLRAELLATHSLSWLLPTLELHLRSLHKPHFSGFINIGEPISCGWLLSNSVHLKEYNDYERRGVPDVFTTHC